MAPHEGGLNGPPAGGEMGAMIQAHDWSRTSLGPLSDWPLSLRAVVGILATSRFAMWMGWGPDLAFLYNDAYAPTLGVKQGWALGRPSREVWAEIWSDIAPRIDQVLTTGQATWDEALMLFLERNGYPEETYHTFSYSPLRDDHLAICGLLCVVTEETDRIISERRLRTLRDLATCVAEGGSEADILSAVRHSLAANAKDLPFCLIYLFDEAGETATLAAACGFADGDAQALARIAGSDPGQLWPTARIWAGEPTALVERLDQIPGLPSGAWAQPPHGALVVAIARQGQDRPAGFLIAGINPHRRLDDATADFLRLVAGQIASALANARAYEAERRRSEALAEIDRAKTAFFSNVSHEFRTPLTLMLGPLQDALAQAGQTSGHTSGAELRPMLELATRNAQRLLRLVNSLLDFSRIEAERVEGQFRPTDLARLTAELASSFESAMQRAGLRFVIDCEPLSAPAYVDIEMWEKIVLNLLSNAFKFTFAGEVRVTLREAAGQAVLQVGDSGTGIPAGEVAHLFERFHRVEGARGRSFEGSGIGLALVRDLVSLHGGSIGVQSEPDHGTTFAIRIPLGAAHLPAARIAEPVADPTFATISGTAFVDEALTWLADAEPPAVLEDHAIGRAAPTAPSDAVTTGRILLAEDNADMRGYVRRLLESAGHQVTSVKDGQSALRQVRQDRPELVLSDVMMPGLDGLGLLRAIRADAALRDTAVILLSARAGENSRIEGLQTQADDYLIKPFSARELLARVGACLGIARLRREALREQRELTERLRESEARFRMVADTAPVLIWLADPTKNCIWLNKAWLDYTGRTMEQDIGSGWADHVHPDDLARCVETYETHFDRREPFRMDFRLRRHDGIWRTHDASGVARRGPDGTFLGYVGSLVDVTDARHAEAMLREVNETLEVRVAERTAERDRLWELSEDLLVAANYDGALLRVSPSWTRRLGYTEAWLLSVHYGQLVHPDDYKATAATLHGMRGRGQPARFENRIRASDGSWRWFAWSLSPDAGDNSLFGVGRDVTAERATRDALLAQIEEREKVEATLRQMQRLEAVGQLTSGVAHDFNNLLTVIIGNIEFLSRGNSDAGMQRRLDMMRLAARRGANLTGQLLAFSRKQHLDPKPLDLNDVVLGMDDLLRSTLGGTVRLQIELGAELLAALADQTQLELVVLNLAINARDAMPVGGTLTIRTANATLGAPQTPEAPPPGDYVMVAVGDSGSGMSPQVRERVFEPFFTTKEPGKGSGLGLAQVYGFAKQSGGGVCIDTELGHGTTVHVYVPRASGVAPAVADPSGGGAAPATGARLRVLLVDDDDAVRETTRSTLQAIGFEVVEADGGEAALAVLAEQPALDLLLVDFAMPGMNGAALARRIAQRIPKLPIVLLTGYADSVALREAGDWPIVFKPFLPDQLAATLRDAIERSRRPSGVA